jgi:hypothetical protein
LREIFCDGFDVGTSKVANVTSQVAAHVDFAVGKGDFVDHLRFVFPALVRSLKVRHSETAVAFRTRMRGKLSSNLSLGCFAFFTFAQRAFCASEIFLRAAADNENEIPLGRNEKVWREGDAAPRPDLRVHKEEPTEPEFGSPYGGPTLRRIKRSLQAPPGAG